MYTGNPCKLQLLGTKAIPSIKCSNRCLNLIVIHLSSMYFYELPNIDQNPNQMQNN